MAEFVHLHLHTEYSLLDGACRIDEVLDQAAKLKMPGIAVTEHGNMFSSVIFHDHARARGLVVRVVDRTDPRVFGLALVVAGHARRAGTLPDEPPHGGCDDHEW